MDSVGRRRPEDFSNSSAVGVSHPLRPMPELPKPLRSGTTLSIGTGCTPGVFEKLQLALKGTRLGNLCTKRRSWFGRCSFVLGDPAL